MKLSKNFSTDEVCISAECPELARKIVLSEEDIQLAELLARSILQPVRDEFGEISILSWKRSPELNKKIKGASDSDHLYGTAADFVSHIHSPEQLFEFIVGSNLPYRQVILYPANFVHVSINRSGKFYKHEAMIFRTTIAPEEILRYILHHHIKKDREIAAQELSVICSHQKTSNAT